VVAASQETQQLPFFCLEIKYLFCTRIKRKLSFTCQAGMEGNVGTAVPIPHSGAGRGQVVSTTARLLYPGERDPVHIVQEVEWASGLVWTGPENLPLTGVPTSTIQHTASHYTSVPL
jgi:hypothetical protein